MTIRYRADYRTIRMADAVKKAGWKRSRLVQRNRHGFKSHFTLYHHPDCPKMFRSLRDCHEFVRKGGHLKQTRQRLLTLLNNARAHHHAGS
jgi:hypothetical protein